MSIDLNERENTLEVTRPGHARVWLYVSTTKLSPDLKTQLSDKINGFLHNWASHGAQLNAWSEIYYDHIVLIALDESRAAASGCSQDALVRYIQVLERDLGITLLDRMCIPIFEADTLHIQPLAEVAKALEGGTLTAKDFTLDLTVDTYAPISAGRWMVSIADTWLKRFLK